MVDGRRVASAMLAAMLLSTVLKQMIFWSAMP